MFERIEKLLKTKNILNHKNQGITVCSVENPELGVDLAAGILYEIVDRRTVLYLSGGSVKGLYEILTKEEKLHPGAVGIIDERYGEKFHQNSNEKMIQETGMLRYLKILDIPFYPVLKPGKSREEVAIAYDEKVRSLHSTFQKSIGILGIGPDGHTSSIIPDREDLPGRQAGFKNPWFDNSQKSRLVSEFNDRKSSYKERVGMTFLGLEMLDLLIVLVFGSEKMNALNSMFSSGSEHEIPARFFTRPEIAKKTLLITDQSV